MLVMVFGDPCSPCKPGHYPPHISCAQDYYPINNGLGCVTICKHLFSEQRYSIIKTDCTTCRDPDYGRCINGWCCQGAGVLEESPAQKILI